MVYVKIFITVRSGTGPGGGAVLKHSRPKIQLRFSTFDDDVGLNTS